LVINISARNDVARVRLNIDWEEKFEVVNVFRNRGLHVKEAGFKFLDIATGNGF